MPVSLDAFFYVGMYGWFILLSILSLRYPSGQEVWFGGAMKAYSLYAINISFLLASVWGKFFWTGWKRRGASVLLVLFTGVLPATYAAFKGSMDAGVLFHLPLLYCVFSKASAQDFIPEEV